MEGSFLWIYLVLVRPWYDRVLSALGEHSGSPGKIAMQSEKGCRQSSGEVHRVVGKSAERISVLVVDDHPMLRERVAEAIQSDPRLQLEGVACDGHEALDEIRRLRPDTVVLDIFMPRMNGDEVLRIVRAEGIEVKIVVLTAYPAVELHAALEQRPDALLFKDATCGQVCDEIVALSNGDQRSAGRILLREATALALTRVRLTRREQLALELAAEGLKAHEAAAHLNVSKRVIEGYLGGAREKLEVSTTTAAVAKAYEIGLLSKGDRGLVRDS